MCIFYKTLSIVNKHFEGVEVLKHCNLLRVNCKKTQNFIDNDTLRYHIKIIDKEIDEISVKSTYFIS